MMTCAACGKRHNDQTRSLRIAEVLQEHLCCHGIFLHKFSMPGELCRECLVGWLHNILQIGD